MLSWLRPSPPLLRRLRAMKMLPFHWSTDDAWKDTAQRGPDDRRPRYDTPQYQNEEDQRRGETNNAATYVTPMRCTVRQ